jgi:hypothetical protein
MIYIEASTFFLQHSVSMFIAKNASLTNNFNVFFYKNVSVLLRYTTK